MKKHILLFSLAFAASILAGCDHSETSTSPSTSVGGGTLTEKEDGKGLKMLYAYSSLSQQVDWEELAISETLEEYYYYDRGTSVDNKIVLLNPDNYSELQKQTSSRKTLKRDTTSDGSHAQFEGALSEADFFALSSKLDTASAGAKKVNANLTENYEYVYFEMDAGYKTLNQTVEYKMYENDYLTNDIHANKLVATDETYENHEEVNEHIKEVMSNQMIDDSNYLVDIMHFYGSELGEDGKYPIPDNYRQLMSNPNKMKISDVFSFPMNKGLRAVLTSEYFETMDKNTEWLSSSVDEQGNTTLKYNHELVYESGSQYAGQGITEVIYATLSSENKLLGYGYDLNFTYNGASLQTLKMDYVYDYEPVGNLVLTEEDEAIFDYNKYYEIGTLLPTIEDGNMDATEAEGLLDQINDFLILNEVNQPTGLVAQDYQYFKTQNEDGQEVEIESLYHQDSTLYNDNVLVTYFSEQGTELDSTYYAESGTIQQFNKDENNYVIREYNGESRYNNGKVTTPLSELENQQISLLNEDVIKNMTTFLKQSKRPGSGITAKIVANLVEAGIDPETNEYVGEHYVIKLQAMTQQTYDSSDNLVPACMFEFEIGFQIIK